MAVSGSGAGSSQMLVDHHSQTGFAVAPDGRVVGSVQLGFALWPNARHRAEVQKLMVHSSARRQGLGRVLMARCLAAVHRSARRWVALRVESDNAPAVHLYRSFGFRPYSPPG